MPTFPSLARARELLAEYDVVPVYREISADLETPVSAFLKICANEGPADGQGGPGAGGREDGPRAAFLLESVERGETVGRYSLLGCAPSALLRWMDGPEGHGLPPEVLESSDPWRALAALCPRRHVAPMPELPSFVGGAVGYWGYETVRFLEPRVPTAAHRDLPVPDAAFMIPSGLAVFDHLRHRILLIATIDAVDAYAAAEALLDDWTRRLSRPLDAARAHPLALPGDCPVPLPELSANMTPEEYRAAVERAKEHIRAGDAFQIVVSRRLSARTEALPFDLYRTLRALNPSPYMFFMDWGDFQLVGSSPEVMVRLDGETATLRPIAGTRRRAHTEEGDRALAAELLADQKERAEHVMLVDLARNDLGRVCEVGSIAVADLMRVERYSHVMHIVSDVHGRVARNRDGLSVLEACFPAGTLTGAPKVRAMQIVADLEPTWRGPYGGAVGYLGFDGSLNTGITIRTMLVRDGTVTVQAGAGVVADSTPEGEYQETLSKAQALLQTLSLAETPART